MMHERGGPIVLPDPFTVGDYIDDFTDFLASYAGWGVVVIVFVCTIVMATRPFIFKVKLTRIQRVTLELFIAFDLLIARSIAVARIWHRPDMPQPYRVVFWLTVFVLCWRFFYFALWSTWVRPAALGTWHYVIKPRVRQAIGLLVAIVIIIVSSYLAFTLASDTSDIPPVATPLAPACSLHACRVSRSETPVAFDPDERFQEAASVFVPIYRAAPTGYVADHEHMLMRWYYPTEVPMPSLEDERMANR